jgi:hypothetical protein
MNFTLIIYTILINLLIHNVLLVDFINDIYYIKDDLNKLYDKLYFLHSKVNQLNYKINIELNDIKFLLKNINSKLENEKFFNNNLINIYLEKENKNINKNITCSLNCTQQIKTIINYYENISQFKHSFKLIPLTIQKNNNNSCLLLYINKPIKNNKFKINNMFKDKRLFTFNYFNNNLCDWYISDMSPSLWKYKEENYTLID